MAVTVKAVLTRNFTSTTTSWSGSATGTLPASAEKLVALVTTRAYGAGATRALTADWRGSEPITLKQTSLLGTITAQDDFHYWVGVLNNPSLGGKLFEAAASGLLRGFHVTLIFVDGADDTTPIVVHDFQDRDVSGNSVMLNGTPARAGSVIVSASGFGDAAAVSSFTPGAWTQAATGQTTGGGNQTIEVRYTQAASTAAVETTAQFSFNEVNRGGVLIEIQAAVGSGTGVTESASASDSVGTPVVAVTAGLTETATASEANAALIPSNTSPENPVGVWTGATASWKLPSGTDSKGNNSLTVSGLSAATIKGPGATFTAAAYARRTAPNLGTPGNFTFEGWVKSTTFGHLFYIGPRVSGTNIARVWVDANGAWNMLRTVGAATQSAKSANGAAVLGTSYHAAAVFASGQDHRLYVNGDPVSLAMTGSAVTGGIAIGSDDEIAIGDPTLASLAGFAGDMGRVTLWPIAMSASRVKASYRQQNDFAQWVGISGENAASDTNRAPAAVPAQETMTAGVAKTIDVIARAYDADGDALSIQSGSLVPSTGVASIVSGRVSWTPPASFVGAATCGFTLRDGGGKSSASKVYATVQAAPPPPSDKWWLIDTLARDGRHWAAGPGYYQASRNNWVTKCGKWCAVTESIKRRCGTGDQDWEGITGGPNTDSLTNPTIKKSSQVDFSGDINEAFAQTDPDTAFMCVVMAAWPRTLSTEEGSLTGGCAGTVRNGGKTDRRVYNEILAGNRDRDYALLGARLKKKFLSYGWTNLDLLVLRINHECNGTNLYQVFPETLHLYRAAMERAYEKMREGAGHRLRIIQSLERKDIGTIQDWMPQSRFGGIDSCNVSWHPADQISNAAPGFYQRYDTFLTKLNSSSYGVLSGEAANAALGLPNVAPEYSPRFEKTDTANPCPVADIALQQFSKYVRQLGRNQNLIFETIFDQTTLQSTAYQGTDAAGKAAWARMVQQIPDLWRGASKGTVPRLDTAKDTVSLSGSGLTYNPFPRCTASGAVRISRIVSTSGGISAALSGSGTDARVQISKGSASPGKKKLVVEMKLANMEHYLTDLEVEVTVT